MQIKNFEDLEIWKEARRLTGEIYRLTKGEKFAKDFGLRVDAIITIHWQSLLKIGVK
jgi:hypothetical protein